jgi:hypothetical protein
MVCSSVSEYLCHKWPRIGSTCRKHFLVLSSFMTLSPELPFWSKWFHYGFSGVHITRTLILCVMFCRSLFVPLSFFFCPLCGLSIDLRILITPLVSSNSSYIEFKIYKINLIIVVSVVCQMSGCSGACWQSLYNFLFSIQMHLLTTNRHLSTELNDKRVSVNFTNYKSTRHSNIPTTTTDLPPLDFVVCMQTFYNITSVYDRWYYHVWYKAYHMFPLWLLVI